MMKTEKIDAALMKHSNDSFILKQRRVHFKLSTRPDRQQEDLKKKYSPINNPDAIGLKSENPKLISTKSSQNQSETSEDVDNEFQRPTYTLYKKEKLNLSWNKISSIGSGLRNLGNTCFLNSVLQCLTYTPPLANILLASEHGKKCKNQQFCMMCELENHVAMALGSGQDSIVPRSIASKIKNIAKHMRIGRQEDAHEFLRFVIERLQNSVLRGYEKLDNRIKETNMIYQIFGGYLQSQVTCLECKYKSNTFDPCLDISLDIKGCDSIKRAFELFVRSETLTQSNKYKCSRCKKLTNAQKQITIYEAPMVLTIQLKRFDFTKSLSGSGKIGKIIDFDEVLSLGPYMSKSHQHENPIYHLYAVLVHQGSSCNSGHYYCFVKNSNGIWYEMNDSSVSQVSLKTVLRQPAYLLFYVRDPSSINRNPSKINKQQENENTNINTTNHSDTNNMKKRKLEDITKDNTHHNKEINKSLHKNSKVEDELNELSKKQSPSEEPHQKKIKSLHKNKESTPKKAEEKESKKNHHNKTNSSMSDELGEKISRKELKKLKKEKQKNKGSTTASSASTNSKQELLNSLLKSTSNPSSASNEHKETSTHKKDSKSSKSSKHSKNKILDSIISNTYNGNGYSNPILKVDYTNKSSDSWDIINNDKITHEESLKSKKSELSKIGNWIIEEKKKDHSFEDEIIHDDNDDDEYVVKNQIKENHTERPDSAPLVTWDEKLETKQEKLERVIARESAHIEKSGEFEVDKSNTLFGSNVALWGEEEVSNETAYEREEFLESTKIRHKKPDNWDMALDAGKVKKTKKQKIERNGDPRIRQEMVHLGFRRIQEKMNKNRKNLEESVKIKSSQKKRIRKAKNKNLRDD